VFFGRQKANDVLLSHMITFLNDKQDWHLRAAFFDSIVGVASYVGWQSLAMLKPLLQMVSSSISTVEHCKFCKKIFTSCLFL
jgi:phosphoinositide-3-kinase regulatory subunit 4